jgi:hypothetical protein
MTLTGFVVLLLPAFVGAVSAAILFQIIDRWRDHRANEQRFPPKQRAVAG